MKVADIILESNDPAKAWIEKVYSQYPQTFQNNHVMTWGSGDDMQFAAFELVPSFSKRGAVEVKWFQAYPLRQGVGSRAMKELQRLAQHDGISLTLYAWDKGQVSRSKLMKFYKGHGFNSKNKSPAMSWDPELTEGGWDTTLTQGTVLHPRIVGQALLVVDKFVQDFNAFLRPQGLGPVKRGRPTGSSAYHAKDAVGDPDKVYGDIDLQMIAPEQDNTAYNQFVNQWNVLSDKFIKSGGASYVDTSESKPGHPIFKVGANDYVQIDFMWHPERLANWGAARVTPEHGVKGLLTGNMYSVLGELLDMSIQHAGVQLKVIDGQHVPFSKQKDTTTTTVSTDPKTFILDLFKYEAEQLGVQNPEISQLLSENPGNDINEVKISKLVNGVKGFAQSCQMNKMFGRGDLTNFKSAVDFLNKFLQRYEEKAMLDVNAKKRDKAATPQAIARAEQDKQKVLQGLETVKGYFK